VCDLLKQALLSKSERERNETKTLNRKKAETLNYFVPSSSSSSSSSLHRPLLTRGEEREREKTNEQRRHLFVGRRWRRRARFEARHAGRRSGVSGVPAREFNRSRADDPSRANLLSRRRERHERYLRMAETVVLSEQVELRAWVYSVHRAHGSFEQSGRGVPVHVGFVCVLVDRESAETGSGANIYEALRRRRRSGTDQESV